ncbi:hypothetical protein BGW38_006010 [Lunasporangiospora selenospora]|uniref:Uncharacterized protein n=1 Tax=Lunasporangiospora selenospora TaxID=979761 RepID=A0A9P6FN39_9FUNG|nr:hypothetical protein BGW38_006010 [Lunasporangiospora selenospora]
MDLALSWPELWLVRQILIQAAIPVEPEQFDQQWTLVYIRHCFQWTDHLQDLFLNMDFHGAAQQQLVEAFVERVQQQQEQPGPGHDHPLGFDGPQDPPTSMELLCPTATLRKRLLDNPSLSKTARLEIIRLELAFRRTGVDLGLSDATLTKVTAGAFDEALKGVQSHLARLQRQLD